MYAFLTFGQGPRNCIGMRYALLQVKVALIRMVANFRVTPGEKMAEGDPVPDLMGQVKGGCWIQLVKRE